MYVMHNWNVIVVYAQQRQRQTLADLTHTHASELEPRAIVLEPSFQRGLDDLELRDTFSWTCGVAGSSKQQAESSLTSACHPAALSCLAAEIAALCLYRPARGCFRFRHRFMRAE